MKYKKALFSIVFGMLATAIYASSLTISSISFSDSLKNPVSNDCKVSSYTVTGKYLSSPSTISGQFSRTFQEIPAVIDNISDGTGWKVKIYANDANGEVVGESEEMNVNIVGSTEISPTIIVDVPMLLLNEPRIRDGNISDFYDVASYNLTLYSIEDDESTTVAIESFPYTDASIKSGRYILSLEALDKDGNTIASTSSIRILMGKKGTIEATLLLSEANKKLEITGRGLFEDNGYLYLEDKDSFSLRAAITPLKKDATVSYKWYISNENEWKSINSDSDTITYKDIKKYADDESFTILCIPTINNIQYSGKATRITPIPDFTPTLYMTGAAPLALDKETSVDISSTTDTIRFSLDLPTYYLGKGINAYYTVDGTAPSDKSEKLIIGNSVSLDAGKKISLRILLIASEGQKKEFKVNISSTKETQTPSISVANRDFGRDLYATLATKTEGASIYYTLDGSDPTSSSTLYTEPFKVKSFGDRNRVTIKAIAVKDGYKDSKAITLNI